MKSPQTRTSRIVLLGVIETVSLDVRYVALDPDTPRRQVWAIERFGAHLEDILGRA